MEYKGPTDLNSFGEDVARVASLRKVFVHTGVRELMPRVSGSKTYEFKADMFEVGSRKPRNSYKDVFVDSNEEAQGQEGIQDTGIENVLSAVLSEKNKVKFRIRGGRADESLVFTRGNDPEPLLSGVQEHLNAINSYRSQGGKK